MKNGSTRGRVAALACAVLAARIIGCGGSGEPSGEADHLERIEAPTLENLGRAAGVGPAAKEVKASGTEVVGADAIDGLPAALEGQDVDAVARALEKARIRDLLVDPGIAAFSPIPGNTAKNRLALGRPAGRLSAVSMTKRLFHYRLGAPPLSLPKEAEEALVRIARDAFGGGEGKLPAGAPPAITAAGKWNLILTVRRVQGRHLSFHAVTANTLAEAAREAGKKARRYYPKVEGTEGPLDKALAEKLTLELEVAYDEGVFSGPRDRRFLWRFIEPGIHGIRANIDGKSYYLPPWYSIPNDLQTVASLLDNLCKKAGQAPGCLEREERPIARFRTLHWHEKRPGGPVEELYRASPLPPSTREVTRERLVEAIRGLADWLADNQTYPSGRYIYRYFPVKDEENKEYNMVRHCVGLFALALAEQFAPSPKYKEKAEAGMRFIEDHVRWGGAPRNDDGALDETEQSWMGKPLPGQDVAIIEYAEPDSGKWSSKLGAVAVAILGYTEYRRTGWKLGPEREKLLEGLARFLLYMYDEKKGNFHHYYVGKKSGLYGTENSIYPGEILYAMARLFGETRDEKYRRIFRQSMETNLQWFKDQVAKRRPDGTYAERQRLDLVQFQPWMAMAMDEMYRYDQDPAYVEASNLVSLWIIDQYQFDETRAFFPDYLGGYLKVLDELPAMHTFVYTEGTAASFDLARRAGADPKTVEKLRKAALLSARFILQQQTRPGVNDYYYPNPKKARGAVRYCLNNNKQRIDYTYHALSSVYRILRAARDEDYASIQAIPMPKTW